MMNPEDYIKLYQKYISGKCSPEEERKLFEYKDSFRFWEVNTGDTEAGNDKILRKQIYARIHQAISTKQGKIVRLWLRYAAAVFMILSAGIAFYFINLHETNKKGSNNEIVLKTRVVTRIDSATALLTLADGSVIPLDEVGNGLLTHEGGIEIRKTKDGELVYGTLKESGEIRSIPNKISIPKGNQYKLTLADGTKVWLNSMSTLVYPSNFTGNERHVELSGEGYFEVAKNAVKPFTVTANGVRVEVLGTHFNVSAYEDDEFVKTTLAEGAVRLSNNNHAVILKPGEQGAVTEYAERIAVKQVSLQHVLAWKEGYFLFKEDNIKDVMRQISRWYNIKVEYEGNIDDKVFGGIYAKSKKLEELLKGLELTGLVKFKIIEGASMEERRVIVMD